MSSLPFYIAAIVTAFCFGIAVVLEREGAIREKKATNLNPKLFLRLIRHPVYLFGILFDIIGSVLSTVAARDLPLFLVQAIIASSIIITAVVESKYRKVPLRPAQIAVICILFMGIVMLSLAAASGSAHETTRVFRIMIMLLSLAVIPPALILLKKPGSAKTASQLAFLGGIAFSTSIVMDRIFPFSRHIGMMLLNPMLYMLVLSGSLGMLVFTAALQHGKATQVNAISLMVDTLIPTILGIIFIGDHVRNGWWPIMGISFFFTIGGVLTLTYLTKSLENSRGTH